MTPNPCHPGLAVLVCTGQAFQLPTSISSAGLWGENIGEGSHTLWQKDLALWCKNSWAFPEHQTALLKYQTHRLFSFNCWFLAQLSWPPCPSLSTLSRRTRPGLHQQQACTHAILLISAAAITSVVSAFNLFLNAPGKCAWTSMELALSAHKVAAKVGKTECLFSHISDRDKLRV